MASLILFDIDGTILDSGGAGRRSLSRAALEVLGVDDTMDFLSLAGKTDYLLLKEIASTLGVRIRDEQDEEFRKVLPRMLEQEIWPPDCEVYPGVRELIEELSAHPDFDLGLVTGNFEACARIKLGAVNLDEPFSFGGFGCDHWDRKKLAHLAVERSPLERYEYDRIVLIGDTPSDIEAARAIGAHAWAVATGQSSNKEPLRQAKPDRYWKDLSDTKAVFDALR